MLWQLLANARRARCCEDQGQDQDMDHASLRASELPANLDWPIIRKSDWMGATYTFKILLIERNYFITPFCFRSARRADKIDATK